MKAFIKAAVAALFAVSGVLPATAQETKDYYKFDDNGFLCEFQLTLPDTTVIRYKHKYYKGNSTELKPMVEGDYANIVYADGTYVDFSASVQHIRNDYLEPSRFPGILAIKENPQREDYYILNLHDWYKHLRKATAAPRGSEMIKNMFDLRDFTITFPDNSQVHVNSGPTVENIRIDEYTDCNTGGDFTEWEDAVVQNIKWQSDDIPFLVFDTKEIKNTSCIVSGTKVDSDWSNFIGEYSCYCTHKGRIITSDKETYTGTFYIITRDAKKGSPLKSNYLKTALAEYPRQLHGFGDIITFAYRDGNVVDNNNKIVAMYRKCKKLDEFDMESVLAAEQGKVDQARAAAQAAAKEKNAITTKYGKKYADAFLAGKVIVGMPWELVQLGLDAHSFKDFYTAFLSIDRSSEYGKTQCYSLYGDDFTHRGHMWVRNNAVESITLY